MINYNEKIEITRREFIEMSAETLYEDKFGQELIEDNPELIIFFAALASKTWKKLKKLKG